MAQSMRLIVSIVERGHGVAMQKLYTARQVFLHLQCAGRGTATSEIMDILGLGSSEKDVVLSFAPAPTCRALLQELKHFKLSITGPRPVAEAIVTSGGVKVGEVNPNSMESKKVRGLFFAGESLDVDAYTGGFNLQIAWSTGHAAGIAAAEIKGEGEL